LAELTLQQKQALALAAARARAAQQAAQPPVGAVPGSRAYADWAAQQARAGKTLPQVSPTPPEWQAPGQRPDMYNSTLATIQGATGAVPFLNQTSDAILAGGQTIGDMFGGKPGDFGANYNAIQSQRDAIKNVAPFANLAGAAGATMLGAGMIGGGATLAPKFAKDGVAVLKEIPSLGSEALGLSGKFGQQLLNSTLSTAGYEGLQGLSHGHSGAQLLADEGIGGGSGFLGSLVGQGIGVLGDSLAKKATSKAQNAAIDAAIGTSSTSAKDIKAGARQMFENSVDSNPLQITDGAYHRLLGDVQNGLQKMRPNVESNPQVVGALKKMWSIADDLNAGGNVAVDMKDLHILRQNASEIAGKGGQDGLMGQIIVDKLDSFINSLKPADIAGGADPSLAAKNLMQGIADWSKAKKMDILEGAVTSAQGARSGYENGLKNEFAKIMRNPKVFNRFSQAEQEAIRRVAQGTTGQNAASLLGTLGLNVTGGFGAKNVLGAGVGTGAMTTALAPFLGPAAFPVAAGATTAAGMVGRRVATDMADTAANRAIQAVANGSIPSVPVARNMLEWLGTPADLAIRGAGLAMMPR